MTLNNLRNLGLVEESSKLALAARPTTNGFASTYSPNDTSAAVRSTIAGVSLAYTSTLRRSLRLQVAAESATQQTPPGGGVDEQGVDAAFAQIFGGCVPISVRLVQAMSLGWPTRTLMATSSSAGGALFYNAATTALQAGRR